MAVEVFGDRSALARSRLATAAISRPGEAAKAGIMRRTAMSAQLSTPIRTGASVPALNVPSPGVR
ncbi:hypothetical protein AB0I05_41590 [Streptomyces phaeochromogenes]